ncbi:hypothetical protein FD755_023548 [Muntiacus reevesi]|uniref:Uncharacterized protein n=1 Tax=Muntiacus reevesi TaxID=9886 RepID=A0A5N3VX30_MUNRE|nr:hypothetical protein FD755_023548 [Muntiacus reevesi]
MPTDGRSSRGRARPRTRAKIRALRRARSKMVNLEGERSANPATGSHPGGSMASASQSSGQASVRGVWGEILRYTVKLWVSQRFGLFLLGFWLLLLLCFYMNSGKITGVGCHALLQGIFPTTSSLCLSLHCCPTNRFISTISLDSRYMRYTTYFCMLILYPTAWLNCMSSSKFCCLTRRAFLFS